MHTSRLAPPVDVTAAPLSEVDTDLLIVPLFEGESPARDGLGEATGGEAVRAVASGELTGKLYQQFLTPIVGAGWRSRRLVLLGAGPAEAYTADRARKLATAIGVAARERKIARLAFALRGRVTAVDEAQAVTEGLILSDFDAASYRTEPNSSGPLNHLTVVMPGREGDVADVRLAVGRGRVLAESSNMARALANEPGNTLTPRVFAERAAAIARDAGLAVDVLDERQIADLRMGLLLGVARGSDEPPRLIVLRHEPAGAPASPVLGLVGKGITFDTGGISIKPADGMERMKDDMAGGAAVICAMRAMALLGAPVRVIGVVPTTENMPGGRAVKPGDVLTSAHGKTVEVINTDAEGRLVLGDGLWYARQLGATHLIDVATLTGAIVVALGKITSGLFGAPDSWVHTVQRVADRAGDRTWPMPLFEEYQDQLRSDIADMVNSAGRPAGAITAAMFLKAFTDGVPWVHMDIAGTAWQEEARPYMPKGPSGVAVRTLAELALAVDEWK